MKRIKVSSLVDSRKWSADFLIEDEANEWKERQITKNSWGKPERWIDGSLLSEQEKLQAVESRSRVGSLGEEIVEYKFLAEYQVVEEDLTAEIAAKDSRIQALRNQLQTLKDFDVDAATLAQMKPFLKLQRSILLKIAQILKASIEGAE